MGALPKLFIYIYNIYLNSKNNLWRRTGIGRGCNMVWYGERGRAARKARPFLCWLSCFKDYSIGSGGFGCDGGCGGDVLT